MKLANNICKLFLTITIISIFSSCNKKEEIGIEIQPDQGKLNVGFKSDFTVNAYSKLTDSILTDESTLNLLGSYFDPIFGRTAASIYTQVLLANNNVNFGLNPVFDSLVLCLAYNSYYGDTTTPLTVHVYELNENMYVDSIYYSNRNISNYGIDYANKTFKPRPRDSVKVNGNTYGPHLRIRLKNTLAQKFINASGTADLATNVNFLNFFKGFYIKADPVNSAGSIQYFSLLNQLSGLYLFYHNDSVSSLTYRFIIDGTTARFTNFNHYSYNGANSDFKAQISGDTLKGANTLYVQAMGGVKTKIKFPDVYSKFALIGNVVINKAELVLKVDETTLAGFNPPDRLSLAKIIENDKMIFLPDQAMGNAYFGGYYNSTTKEYRFTISKYIQQLVSAPGEINYGIYLMVSGSADRADRVILNGYANTPGNIRLEVTYTKIN